MPPAAAILASCPTNLVLTFGASPTIRLTERSVALLLGYAIQLTSF